jgi:hypothetical protein
MAQSSQVWATVGTWDQPRPPRRLCRTPTDDREQLLSLGRLAHWRPWVCRCITSSWMRMI